MPLKLTLRRGRGAKTSSAGTRWMQLTSSKYQAPSTQSSGRQFFQGPPGRAAWQAAPIWGGAAPRRRYQTRAPAHANSASPLGASPPLRDDPNKGSTASGPGGVTETEAPQLVRPAPSAMSNIKERRSLQAARVRCSVCKKKENASPNSKYNAFKAHLQYERSTIVTRGTLPKPSST